MRLDPGSRRRRLEIGDARTRLVESAEAGRQAPQRDPRARVDATPQQRALAARDAALAARDALGQLREPLVQPERAIATAALGEHCMGELVEEQRTQFARRMRGRRDVDAAVEESDGREGEAVLMRGEIGRLAVEHDPGRLARRDAESRDDVAIRLFQIAQHRARIVGRRFTESRVVADAKVRALRRDESQRTRRALLRREPALIAQPGESPLGGGAPVIVRIARVREERFEVSLRCLESPALAIEQRQIPVRFGISRLDTHDAFERRCGTRGLAATQVVERAAHEQIDTALALASIARRRPRRWTDHAPAPEFARATAGTGQTRGIRRHRLRIVAYVRLSFGVDPHVQFGVRRGCHERTPERCKHDQRPRASQAPFAASEARCGNSGSNSFSTASRIAAREPGNAATTRPRTVPASARESSAAEPIC